MKKTLLCAVLAVLLVSALAADNSWDYFMLVIEWSGAACVGARKGCSVPDNVNDFSLHGLWPNRNDTTYPSFCDNSKPFDASQIKDLLPEMEIYWADELDPPGSTSFWEHEWNKHGTCSLDDSLVGSQHQYFQAALNLRKQANIMPQLLAHGIKPSNTTQYNTNDVVTAVSSGVAPGYIWCAKDAAANASVFSYVAYCVDKNLHFFECDDAFQKQHLQQWNCPAQILIPLGH